MPFPGSTVLAATLLQIRCDDASPSWACSVPESGPGTSWLDGRATEHWALRDGRLDMELEGNSISTSQQCASGCGTAATAASRGSESRDVF